MLWTRVSCRPLARAALKASADRQRTGELWPHEPGKVMGTLWTWSISPGHTLLVQTKLCLSVVRLPHPGSVVNWDQVWSQRTPQAAVGLAVSLVGFSVRLLYHNHFNKTLLQSPSSLCSQEVTLLPAPCFPSSSDLIGKDMSEYHS